MHSCCYEIQTLNLLCLYWDFKLNIFLTRIKTHIKSRNTIQVYFIITKRTLQLCTILVFVKLLSSIIWWGCCCTIILMTDLSPRGTSYVMLFDIHLFGYVPPYPWPPVYVTVHRTEVHDFKFNYVKQWKPDVLLKQHAWVNLDLVWPSQPSTVWLRGWSHYWRFDG